MEVNILKIASGIIASMSGDYVSNFTTKVSRAVKLTSGFRPPCAQENIAAAGANLLAAGTRITDADSAREIIEFTKLKILKGAKSSLSGQANLSQKDILNLINN